MSEFQKDELSLEETNKLRIQLGLKPLAPDSDDERDETTSAPGTDSRKVQKQQQQREDDDDPLTNQDEKAAKNYAAYQESLRRKREEDETRGRIAKAQNRRELSRKLQGRTLGEADDTRTETADGGVDAKKWLKAQRKKAKENELRLQKQEEEADAAAKSDAARSKYDSDDLHGLKVAHDVDEFDLEGGEERVLTLRDAKILDNEDDELMDSALDQAERDRILAERKKGVKKYSGLDDDEFEAGNVGRGRGVLSKYDGDIEKDGFVRDSDAGFRLGGAIKSRGERNDEKRRESERMLNRTLLNLDYSKNVEMSDYFKEGDVGFKKPKTKKKRKETGRIRLDDDEDYEDRTAQDVPMTNGASPSTSNRRFANEDVDLVDDDDLAASLAIARRRQAKKAFQKMTPEMIARNLAAQRAAEEEEGRAARAASSAANGEDTEMVKELKSSEGVEQPASNTLTFDETSEFVRNISSARDASTYANDRSHERATPSTANEEQVSTPVNGAVKNEPLSPPIVLPTTEGVDANDLLRPTLVKEEQESDEEMIESALINNVAPSPPEEKISAAEPLVSGGLASTLSILRSQGQLNAISPEEREREQKQRNYDAWLAKRRVDDKVREAQLAASKAQGSAKDQATREYENRMREMEDSRMAQERFKEYKPDIDIKYHDEFGRELDHHEAWKHLSHTFHHKMPGKKKQERRLQKIENERQREKMLAGDTPTGMTKAFAERAERSGQAHMVLGVGARNNAPQDAGLLGPNTVSRNGDKGKGRHRAVTTDDDGAGDGDGSYRMTSAAMAEGSVSVGRDARSGLESDMAGITSFVPRSTTAKSKAGFAPIKRANSVAASAAAQGSASPGGSTSPMTAAPVSKFKLAFGASKRLAPPSSNGFRDASPLSPPAKQVKRE